MALHGIQWIKGELMSNVKIQSSNKAQSSNDKIKIPSPLGERACPDGHRGKGEGDLIFGFCHLSLICHLSFVIWI